MPPKIKDNLSKILQIKNSTETSADLYFYGDIVSSWWGAYDDTDQYPESIKNFLDEAKGKNLNIYMNCGGGSVFAGMAIYNMLKRHEGFKTVFVDGLAASIASVIVLAGDKVIIPSNAYFMIHKPLTDQRGNADDFREMANILDKIQEGIENAYAMHLKDGVDIKDVHKLVNAETWMTGLDAAKYFDFELSAEIKAVACAGDSIKNYSSVPANINKENSLDKESAIKTCSASLNLLKLKGEINAD